jgi:hypothetical protein
LSAAAKQSEEKGQKLGELPEKPASAAKAPVHSVAFFGARPAMRVPRTVPFKTGVSQQPLKPRAHSGPKSAELFRKVKGMPFQGIDFSTGLEKKTLQANDLTPMMWNEILPQGIH